MEGVRPHEHAKEVMMRSVRISLVVAALTVAPTAAWPIDIEGTEVVVPVAMHGPGALGTSPNN